MHSSPHPAMSDDDDDDDDDDEISNPPDPSSFEECSDDGASVDILHPQSSHDAVLMQPECFIDDRAMARWRRRWGASIALTPTPPNLPPSPSR